LQKKGEEVSKRFEKDKGSMPRLFQIQDRQLFKKHRLSPCWRKKRKMGETPSSPPVREGAQAVSECQRESERKVKRNLGVDGVAGRKCPERICGPSKEIPTSKGGKD